MLAQTLLASLLPAYVAATGYMKPTHQGSSSSAPGTSLLQSTAEEPCVQTGTNACDTSGGNSNGNAGNARGDNYCTSSSFGHVDRSEEQDPLVDDCQSLITQIANADQNWNATTHHSTLVYRGSCGFNAYLSEGPQGAVAYVGNADVVDLINSSIDLGLTKNGRINCEGEYSLLANSKGQMGCNGNIVDYDGKPIKLTVKWTLGLPIPPKEHHE